MCRDVRQEISHENTFVLEERIEWFQLTKRVYSLLDLYCQVQTVGCR